MIHESNYNCRAWDPIDEEQAHYCGESEGHRGEHECDVPSCDHTWEGDSCG